MNGLVSGYGSDSDEDDGETIQRTKSPTTQVPPTEWTLCYDESSGYPYYWNYRTNEVRWEKPEDQPQPQTSNFVPPLPPSDPKSQTPSAAGIQPPKIQSHSLTSEPPPPPPAPAKNGQKSTKSHATTNGKGKVSKSVQPLTFIGPMMPELSAEELALQKVQKFEEDLAGSIIIDIGKEIPPDWTRNGSAAEPKHYLYSKEFKWKRANPILPEVQLKEEEYEIKKKTPNSISLIAGNYGDNSDQESESEASIREAKRLKRKIQVQVKSLPSKQPRTQLKPVPSVFQQSSDMSDEGEEEPPETRMKEEPVLVEPPKVSVDPPKATTEDRKSRRDTESSERELSKRRFIEKTVEMLTDKLESIKVSTVTIPLVKVLAIQIEVLFSAWQCGALNTDFFKEKLVKMTEQLNHYESHKMVPPGWKPVWDRLCKKYTYENLVTGEIQDNIPEESDDEEAEDSEDYSNLRLIGIPPLPPLPPSPSKPPLPDEVPLPPLPPSLPASKETQSRVDHSQVQDMELSDDDDANADDEDRPKDRSMTDVLNSFYSDLGSIAMPDSNPPNNSSSSLNKDKNMKDVIDSFYSDLASIDTPTGGSQATTPIATPPLCHSPLPSSSSHMESVFVESPDERSNSPFRTAEGDEVEKRKRKVKYSSGLSMKKKGVENLVAKWQNIQEEVKKQNK